MLILSKNHGLFGVTQGQSDSETKTTHSLT